MMDEGICFCRTHAIGVQYFLVDAQIIFCKFFFCFYLCETTNRREKNGNYVSKHPISATFSKLGL
jgi:hypothetical protein